MTRVRLRPRLRWLALVLGLASAGIGLTSTPAFAAGESLTNGLPHHFCLDIRTEDSPDRATAQLWNCTGVDEQSFVFIASAVPNEFTIHASGSRATGRCLTSGPGNGAVVFQEPCTGSTPQLWEFNRATGNLQIQSIGASGCLQASTDALHAVVITSTCLPSSASVYPAQIWTANLA